MRAIVIGATGAVGKDLVKLLLNDDTFESVTVLARRKMDVQHPKLHVRIVDFSKPESWEQDVVGDVAFSCMGTSLKQAGSKEAQWKIDHGIQLAFTRAAQKNHVETFFVVSSMGASSKSKSFYMRMKGVIEEDIQALHLACVYAIRPSSLIRESTKRWTESVTVKLIQTMNCIGLFKSLKPIPTQRVAHAMVELVKSGKKASFTIVPNSELWKL